jgi:putative transposase
MNAVDEQIQMPLYRINLRAANAVSIWRDLCRYTGVALGLGREFGKGQGGRKMGKNKNFWARGYFVSTVGADEDVVRTYIREQEQEDNRVEQLRLFR